MRGKQYKRAQLQYAEHLFKSGKNAGEVADALGITAAAARKLRQRMREAGWQVGTGTNLHPMPRPEVANG
jgi:ribosomal protein L10